VIVKGKSNNNNKPVRGEIFELLKTKRIKTNSLLLSVSFLIIGSFMRPDTFFLFLPQF